jgi:hypothetical protein
MTDAPPRRVRPTWLTIGIFIAIGATLFLAGVTLVNSMPNRWDDGVVAGAAGALMLLVGIFLLMIRAVRLGMRQ